MATTDRLLPGLHEDKIMKRLLNRIRQTGLARRAMVGLAASLYVGVALVPVAHASDTEVYARKGTVSGELAPTMMMMIDTSGSMDWCINGSTSSCTTSNPKRRVALVNAMQKILFGAPGVDRTPGYVRMGLSRYHPSDASKGGYVQYPARPLDAFVDINPDGAVESKVALGAADAEQDGSLNLASTELDLGLGSVGLQFASVMVPKGAKVVEAYVEFTASRNVTGVASAWDVHAQAIDNAPVFSGTSDIDSRTYETAPDAVASEGVTADWVKEQKYRLNVVEPLNYVVNRSGWCGGNDVVLRIRRPVGSGADRFAYSFEGAATKAPRLVVNYTIDPKMTGSCIRITRSASLGVMSNEDDYEYTEGNSVTSSRGTGLDFATIASNKRNQVVFRFTKSSTTDLEIPQGAEILSANLNATGYANDSGLPALLVGVFDTANFGSTSGGGTNRNLPTTAVTNETSWSLPGNQVVSNRRESIDVKPHVQLIVNKAGWSGSNGIGFRLRSSQTTTAASRAGAFYHREGSTSKSATLDVTYRQTITNLAQLKTARDELWEEIQALNFNVSTPLGAAYVETMRYMMGLGVYAPAVDSRVTVNGASTTYKTPIKADNQCSANYVFALTDGEPTETASVGENSSGVLGASCPTSTSTYPYWGSSGYRSTWQCMQAVADWGLSPDKNQIGARVRTSTVFFGKSDTNTVNNLTRVAKVGGGAYYSAGSEAELVRAISQTVSDLLDANGSITAPGVAVNQLNRLNNLDQLFYAVFDPEVQRAFWPGNVKRYRLDIEEEDVFDVNDRAAVDESTSFFKTTAQSWWSPGVDGEKAREGGAASVLPDPASRKMFTYLGSMPSSGSILTQINPASGTFVSAGKAVTGISDTNEFVNLINWYRGYEIEDLKSGLVPITASTIRRKEIGGVLHSRPILVNYGFSGTPEAAAKDPDLQDNVLFFSTMEGTLHAVDAKTGLEYFSFIPGEKLAVLPVLFANPSQEMPEFGMDLTWSVLRKDENNDGKPEKVYVYGGMRMGGRNYYALDVTNRSAPKLLFAIEGGDGGFSKLGQTWSQPAITSMRVNGDVRSVLVFGGGYDPKHEVENIVYSGDDVGNAIYIVDALTGDLIWSGDSSDNSDMKFSIPGQPKVLDVTGDGLADHIYFGDLGGQVFRVDLDNRVNASDLVVRVKTLAKVAGSSVANQRRFYEPPTVALFKDSGNQIFAAVALGSGYRSHPLNESTTDHYFTFFDYDVPRADVMTSSSLQPMIKMSDLVEVKPADSVSVSVAGKKGWYISFPDKGEKVITSGLFFRNTLVFSSYVPSIEGGDACSPVVGRSKLYRVSLASGGFPTGFLVKDNSVLGLGGDPQLVILESGDKPTPPAGDAFDNGGGALTGESGSCSDITIVAGTDVEEFEGCVRASLKRTRWTEKLKQE